MDPMCCAFIQKYEFVNVRIAQQHVGTFLFSKKMDFGIGITVTQSSYGRSGQKHVTDLPLLQYKDAVRSEAAQISHA